MATPHHYLNNKDLYYEIIVSKAKGDLTPKAQKMFILLCERVQSKFYYYREIDKEDTLQHAYLHLFDAKKWSSFNEEITRNAFAFFTEITKRALAQGFNLTYKVRGMQPGHKTISLDTANDGGQIYNI